MLPYFVLVLTPIVIYLIGLAKKKHYDKLCICVFFGFFIILLSLRGINCGIDLKQYQYYFNYFATNDFGSSYLADKGEILYYFLNKVVHIVGGNYQLFLTIVAFLSITPLAYLYYKKANNSILTIALFLTIGIFPMYFSGLRQILAIGVIIYAFRFIQEKKMLKYILCVIIAMLFHKSALLCIILYPIYHIKLNKNWIYFIFPLLLIIYIIRKPIFITVLKMYNPIYDNLYGTVSQTGQYTTIILLFIFVLYCFLFPNKEKINSEYIGLRNFLLLSLIIQMFVPLNVSVMRLNYYLFPFIPILIPKVYEYGKDKNKSILQISKIVMILFFISYFFYNAYTGEDILQIFPYIPFWR